MGVYFVVQAEEVPAERTHEFNSRTAKRDYAAARVKEAASTGLLNNMEPRMSLDDSKAIIKIKDHGDLKGLTILAGPYDAPTMRRYIEVNKVEWDAEDPTDG